VSIPAPYWLSYPEIVKLADGVPVYGRGEKATGYKVDVAMLEAVTTDKTKALVLNTPSNPTGMIYSEDELRAIADYAVKHDIYVVADEMYEYLVYNGKKHVSIASFNDEIYKRTITVSGLAKSYAMTGWRIGYTGSSEEIAKLMGSVQSHQTSNPNSIAQKAAVEALKGDQSTVNMMLEKFDERRKYMYDRFAKMPYVSVLEPEGAFYVFVDVSEVLKKSYKGQVVGTAAEMARILIDEFNVAVVPCADFGFDDHIRLSYAISVEQIDKGVTRIENFLNELN
ncbi:MAG: pyridoxal phosphate-dependent aminotransferase, partial [Lachnospiraceae bacterium]|nr:pyridoxal phosphate-dependent aminotransferase [Lachnospiraceae bacterium]